ncbi:hypothetical protein [Ferrimonas marina]|uniref:Uncharacterized protein n=1 Tax=Ferrimonas marina TaxID=299255 RepID=A0A1M5TKX7_9GAMM|nr:hypothetical protein [Ferrimonas marina]SHH51331.1 hypothetical protein SAMN02745129_2184 [Ferrimonas marina]
MYTVITGSAHGKNHITFAQGDHKFALAVLANELKCQVEEVTVHDSFVTHLELWICPEHTQISYSRRFDRSLSHTARQTAITLGFTHSEKRYVEYTGGQPITHCVGENVSANNAASDSAKEYTPETGSYQVLAVIFLDGPILPELSADAENATLKKLVQIVKQHCVAATEFSYEVKPLCPTEALTSFLTDVTKAYLAEYHSGKNDAGAKRGKTVTEAWTKYRQEQGLDFGNVGDSQHDLFIQAKVLAQTCSMDFDQMEYEAYESATGGKAEPTAANIH